MRKTNIAILIIIILWGSIAVITTQAKETTQEETKKEIIIEYYEAEKKEQPKKTIEQPKEEKTVEETIKEIFGENWRIAYAVAKAENRALYAGAIGYNKDERKTIDRGIFQINSYWHSEVDDACAYDMRCNIQEAFRISKGGTQWREWWTYKNKLHLKYM